jgi:hypothetical protein
MLFVLGTDMTHINNYKEKNNTIITATAKVFSLATILVVAAGVTITPLTALASRTTSDIVVIAERKLAPSVVTGDNIYIAWWTNNTENGNEEVMFRASNDGGDTFGDKINLSNTTDADSWRVEIAGEGENVVVSWWETNQTSDIPVARISTDAGETFGPMLRLGANGTISDGTEEGGQEEGETVEEEAVGGAEVAE